MILSQTAEYALRAMIALRECDPCTTSALSERIHVPAPYLAKVLQSLGAAGLVEGQRGKGGGYRLTRPSSEITFKEILEAVGVELALTRCAFGMGDCDTEDPCPLHGPYEQLLHQINSWAAFRTLAEVGTLTE